MLKLKPIHASDIENRDRFVVFRVVRSRHFHCLNCARRIQAAGKNERDSCEESRDRAAYLD